MTFVFSNYGNWPFNSRSTKQEVQHFLLGKAGSGKSRTGNSIIGNPNAFKFGTPTDDCTVEIIEDKSGKTIHVIDTPSDASADHNLKKIEEKINQFTESDSEAYKKYKSLSDCEGTNTIVIFTCFDKWENDMKDSQITNPEFTNYLSSLSHHNKSLLHSCGRHWVAFNNRLKGEKNDNQVNNLLEKIDEKLSTVCQSRKEKIKTLFLGPKDIANCGAVPSTQNYHRRRKIKIKV
ncbi:unnamed protein product [Mytilus edulis]|uniref:AIG1-type G domain-containing protein n=1 Tax=Mytilus edulis TaxID=6550 RepID=A0A8S3T3E9_MYTED|nr:unnamed protein product [Mytilus edulis]